MDSRLSRLLGAADAPTIGIAVVEDLEVRDVVRGNALFQSGSVAKAVTALVALELVAADELDLDKDINAQLRSWQLPGHRVVTLRQLLSHTAGIGVPFFPGYAQGDRVPGLNLVLDGSPPATTPPVRVEHEIGKFHYSGGGYAIVQQLLEDASGQPFDDLAQRVVLEPLGMRSSTFAQPLPADRTPEAARHDWRIYPEAAAAGLWTTPLDLARFVAALQRALAKLATPITHSSAHAMLTPTVKLPDEGDWNVLATLGVRPPDRFGLGLFLEGSDRFSHLGGAANFYAIMTGSVVEGNGGVIMSAANASTALFEIAHCLSDQYMWNGFLIGAPAETPKSSLGGKAP